MNIAFLHYHLKTGGVTTVIKGQVAAARRFGHCVVITGDGAGALIPCPVIEIPGLGYDSPGGRTPRSVEVARQVLKALADAWPGGCDLLHVHNPLLAKNRRFLEILDHLQDSGIPLFLQVHDFAEDGRPDAYFPEPYPADCHYGVLNSRDKGILLNAGLDPFGVHLLPNAISPLPDSTARQSSKLVLYPVRAIRRKNLGEALLLSMFMKPHQRLAITQPPNSARDWPCYRDWKKFSHNNRFRVDFEAGRDHDFLDLVKAAASMVTTSITEGFGLSFLEPWTVGKYVWGRKLAAICRDFENNGVHLDTLYERIDIPLDWFDSIVFNKIWRDTIRRTAKHYGHPLRDKAIGQAWSVLTSDDVVDFGVLNEGFQKKILERLMAEPAARRQLKALNPKLFNPTGASDTTRMIHDNQHAVAAHYSWEGYGKRLQKIYRQVLDHAVRHSIDKKILIKAFMDLKRFSLLKWCPYVG